MFKYFSIATIWLFTAMAVRAQAPLGPAMETNLNRIDSLTMLLYEDIPSHTAVTDSLGFYGMSEEDFESKLKLMGSSIPLDFHAMVSAQVNYLLRQDESYYNMLHKRMQLYFPLYEQVLDKNALPQELKYVSIIESNLNPNAVSWCGATGLWQFMPYTGRSMGMRIDYSIDERKSIIRSTEKACEYFKNSYSLLGDWLLAIASYNCGAGYVQQAIRRSGGSHDFWVVKNFLPRETQNYVPRFIAAVYVLNFTKFSKFNHNVKSSVLVPTPVDSAISIKHLAGYLQADEEELNSYNRELLTKVTQPGQIKNILLPYGLSMQFLANRDSAYAYARKQKAIEEAAKPQYVQKWVPGYHYVTRGQTLYSISRRYGITIYQLKAWNNLKTNFAPLGKTLIYYKLSWVKQS
jgi:membrane-bound lytic murein transglycosylase D